MAVVKVEIIADPALADTLGDYLLGVMEMAVECRLDDDGVVAAIHGFIDLEQAGKRELAGLCSQIAGYGREAAVIFGLPEPAVRAEVIDDQDWGDAWKQHFKPFAILPHLVIAPSWEPGLPEPGQQQLVIDPGMAFGTGHHATTRLCLEMLWDRRHGFAGRPVLDLGTGTGILAMAAALWGAASVTAVDNDPEALAAAERNLRRNELQHAVKVVSQLPEEQLGSYAVVVANIVHDTLAELAGLIGRAVAESGEVILAGLVLGQADSLVERCRPERLVPLERRRQGEWEALRLIKRKSVDDAAQG